MDAETEKRLVAEIEEKLDRGEELTEREWNIRAYSPLGTAGACHACATALARPGDVTDLYSPPGRN